MVCVPLIFWSVLAFLWTLPGPWVFVVAGLMLAFYLALGLIFFGEMTLITALSLIVIRILDKAGLPVLLIAGVIFVAAWLGQFYGHKVEGKKPAFFNDLVFLLIGPLWIVNSLKRKQR